jgi:Ni,Fe-hydrogenase III large subunit
VTAAFHFLRGQPIAMHRPWPRLVVTADAWAETAGRLHRGALTLLGLWGEPDQVHMVVADAEDAASIRVLSLPCPDGRYPSVGRLHPPAIRLERAAADLFGLVAEGLPDPRPWLDHSAPGYAFLPVEGENLHEVPVGPVHAGIIEPGHFRFTADGETVVRLEARLGYTHKGIEALMHGSTLEHAARLAGRCSGDSTVAYALAFAQAAEAALGWEPPPRAVWLRAMMAEMERLANHLGDVGAICNDAAFAIMLANCSVLREGVLRESAASFGHRLMMDRVIPGGVSADPDATALARIAALAAETRRRFRPLIALYEKTASLLDRTVGTGFLKPSLAAQFAAGGFIGRASGRSCDARRAPGYAPYPALDFEVPMLTDGDVHGRLWVRVLEIEQSLRLIEQIAGRLPAGAIRSDPPPPRAVSEGMALVEGFRGDILVWLRIEDDGLIGRCHLRDPSWFQWPLLEAVIEGNIIADFPLCNKSFNCSYSGADL